MKQEFINMAKSLSELKIYDILEVANFLEVNFDLIKIDKSDSILNRRKILLAEFELLSSKRSMIENQLLLAKSKFKEEGIKSDSDWLIKTKYAFRITKQQIDSIKGKLTQLKTEEREINLKRHFEEDEKMLRWFIEREKIGKTKDEFLKIIEDIRKNF